MEKKPKKKKNKYIKTGFFYNIGRNILWHFAAFIFFTYMFFFFRFKIEGKEKLKSLKKRGYVITVNHCNIWDSIIVMFSIYPKKLRIATLASNIKIFLAGGIIALAGGVGLPKDYAGLKCMTEEMAGVLRDGEIALYMPEAHLIQHCPVLREFKKGAFMVAKKAGVPVVPTAHAYRLNWRGNIRYTLKIGDPIESVDLSVEEIKDKAYTVMKEFTSDNANVFYKSKFYEKLKKKNKLLEYEQFENPYERQEEKASVANADTINEM